MLLSDRDLRTELDSGRVVLDPYDPGLVQPSSIDVRLDSLFRVFENHRYAHIDPAQEQPDLTREVAAPDGRRSSCRPGEFVLGAALERVTLPERSCRPARRASSRPAGPVDAFDGQASSTRLRRSRHPGAVERRHAAHQVVAWHEGGPALLLPAGFTRREAVRPRRQRLEVPGRARARAEPVVLNFPVRRPPEGVSLSSQRAQSAK